MIDTHLLAALATNARFTSDAILIDVSHLPNVRLLLENFENHFAVWASVMNKKATIIKGNGAEMRVPASIAIPEVEIAPQDEPSRLLFFANVAVCPALLVIANDLMNNPRRAGVVRLCDELQVIQSEANKILNPGHTMQESCTWTRSQFWDAQDLDDFRREVRLHGERVFEFTWKSFDPSDATKTNDLEVTTRYKLFDGGNSRVYQLCENLDMRELVF